MDQFRQVLPGETLPGFPGRAWNKMLEGLSQNASGPFAGSDADGPIEISVKNTTGAALGRFAILGIATPTITKANDANQFYVRDLMDGIAPTATSTIVITQTTLGANEIGRARVLGLARVQVDITDETHTHAVPTTSTSQLTSSASGPAKILHKASAGTGVKWCVVLLGGQGDSTLAAFIRFALPSALATTDASKAACTVDDFWGGTTPGATVTVYNLPASTDYMFSSFLGAKGVAVYDEIDSKYWIIQLECGGNPPSITIAETGVTGGDTDALLYSDGTAVQTASGTQIVSENLELDLGTDRWVAFSVGSY